MYCVVERTSAVDSVTDEVKVKECCGISRQNQCNAGLQDAKSSLLSVRIGIKMKMQCQCQVLMLILDIDITTGFPRASARLFC